MQPLLRNMTNHTRLKVTPVCNEHNIAYCGVCAEKYGTESIKRIAQSIAVDQTPVEPPSDTEIPLGRRAGKGRCGQCFYILDISEVPPDQVCPRCGGIMECDKLDDRRLQKRKDMMNTEVMECDKLDMGRKRRPAVMECDNLPMNASARQRALIKLATHAHLRNDVQAFNEIKAIVQLGNCGKCQSNDDLEVKKDKTPRKKKKQQLQRKQKSDK